MDTDWHSVFQFVGEPLDLEFAEKIELDGQADEAPSLLQIPTPPQSHDGSPVVDDEAKDNTLVSVSTTFFPGSQHLATPPDTVLLTSDNVFFYVHSQILLAASENRFRELLLRPSDGQAQDPGVIHVPENSTVLNIILHTVYDMSCIHYSPSFAALVTTVNRLPTYGIPPKKHIATSTPLFTLLLSHAPLYPLELYALAASHDLYDLAVSTSSHLLSFPLASLTDQMAEHIGPIYLKRLFFLHFGRSDALKRVLLPPPHPHPPTPFCDFTEQKKLTRAWALASAYLAWDARPDLSTKTMESALRPLSEHLTCKPCQEALNDRITNLVKEWSIVKDHMKPFQACQCDAIHDASTHQTHCFRQTNTPIYVFLFHDHCNTKSAHRKSKRAPTQNPTSDILTLHIQGHSDLLNPVALPCIDNLNIL